MTSHRRCKTCGQSFPLTAEYFHRDSSKRCGFRATCKSCKSIAREASKAKAKASNIQTVDDRKAKRSENKELFVKIFGNKCECCGRPFHASAYDFHHRDPSSKSFAISDRYVLNKEMLQELAKCDMLCRNCHAGLHAGEIKWDPVEKIYYKSEWDAFGEVYIKRPVRM